MIVYDLTCSHGHRFEGWFGSSADFASQKEEGLLACPECGCPDIAKAPMSPAVGKKGNQLAAIPASSDMQPVSNAPFPPGLARALEQLAKAQAKALKNSKWVGSDFAERSRSMHYGESEQQAIHGEATAEDARDLIDEGIPVAPLPFPVAPPDELN